MTPLRPPALLAIVVTALVAVTCYLGAVTERGLVVFVGPAALLGAIVTAGLIAQRRPRSAVFIGLAVALAWSELVNVVSGMGYGPAARSSFAAGAGTALAVVVAATPAPAGFLVPVSGIVLGALVLGAGGEVRAEAVATAVVAAVALAIIESERRHWAGPRRRQWSVAVLPLLAAATSIAVVVGQAHGDGRRPSRGATASIDSHITPPYGDPFPAVGPQSRPTAPPVRRHHHRHRHSSQPPPNPTRGTAGAPAPTRSRHTAPASTGRHTPAWQWALLAVGALLVVLLLLALARLITARWSWWRLRRRLRNGEPAAAVAGAWEWARVRLAAGRLMVPSRISPDLAARGVGLDDLPPTVSEALRELGALVTPLVFGPEPITAADADRAWVIADDVARCGQAALSRTRRMRQRFSRAPRLRPLIAGSVQRAAAVEGP